MAKYRQVHTSFWQDGFVLDLTPDEKYFYLYLMTNPKTSQCGIYELPKRIIEIETGYSSEKILSLIQRFIDYKKIDYFEGSKEVMLINWIRYNPLRNLNLIKRVVYELESVKCEKFSKLYISSLDSDLEFDKEGLVRGLQGAYEGLPSNRVKSKEERIKNKEEGIRKITFLSDSIEYRLSQYLFNWIKKNNKDVKEPNFENWSKTFDLIIRIDKRDFEEIKKIIKWTQENDFWFKIILSPTSLRKHYDKFILEIKTPTLPKKGKTDNFNNYEQRTYDYDDLEKKLLGNDTEQVDKVDAIDNKKRMEELREASRKK